MHTQRFQTACRLYYQNPHLHIILMKKYLLSLITLVAATFGAFAQGSNDGLPTTGKTKWSINPFEHALFVENKGQFDTIMPGDQILYEAKLGSINAYFTPKGVMYRHIETEKLDFSHGDPDQNGPP